MYCHCQSLSFRKAIILSIGFLFIAEVDIISSIQKESTSFKYKFYKTAIELILVTILRTLLFALLSSSFFEGEDFLTGLGGTTF